MTGHKNYAIRVTLTKTVELRVCGASEEDARVSAINQAITMPGLSSREETTTLASWPWGEREERMVEEGGDLEVWRGWFHVTDVYRRPYHPHMGKTKSFALGLRPNEFHVALERTGAPYDASAEEQRLAFEDVFSLLALRDGISSGSSFYYGFGARRPGSPYWIVASTRDRAHRDLRREEEGRKEGRRRQEQIKHAVEHAIGMSRAAKEAVAFMKQSKGALTKAGLGRWTTTLKLEGRPYSTTLEGEWFVNRDVVDHLLRQGLAQVFDKYPISHDPRTIILTDAGWADPT